MRLESAARGCGADQYEQLRFVKPELTTRLNFFLDLEVTREAGSKGGRRGRRRAMRRVSQTPGFGEGLMRMEGRWKEKTNVARAAGTWEGGGGERREEEIRLLGECGKRGVRSWP